MRARGGTHLIELHPGLGARLRDDERHEATQALRVPLFELEAGPVDLDGLRRAPELAGSLIGVAVVRGTLTRTMRLDGRLSSQLVVADDLVLLDGLEDDSLPTQEVLAVTATAHVAVLDDRLLAACRRWPRLLLGVLQRLSLQASRAHRSQAINQLPRVEDRLLGLFWTFADHHGRVHADGIHIDLPLTHAAIGEMIGARRPTVSLGLTTLADAGLLVNDGSVWIIDPSSLQRFGAGAPLELALPRRSKARDDPGATHTPAGTVLVVSTALGRYEPDPFRVLTAADESAAASLLAEHDLEVVVLHLQDGAPSGFGETVLTHLRQDQRFAHTRVIVLHQNPAGEPSRTVMAATHDYIAGPFSIADLSTRIEGQVSVAQALRRARAAGAESGPAARAAAPG